jgi:hypothetical protein
MNWLDEIIMFQQSTKEIKERLIRLQIYGWMVLFT